jgi:hypothetical protein
MALVDARRGRKMDFSFCHHKVIANPLSFQYRVSIPAVRLN